MKIEITIANPTLTATGDSNLIRSFLSSNVTGSLYVQFVFLINTPQADRTAKSDIQHHGTHEILYVRNRRFFPTAEENMYRVQDFIDLLKPYVFFVGDDDPIDWAELVHAMESLQSRDLAAMAWNVANVQIGPDGPRKAFDAVGRLNDTSRASEVIEAMHRGDVVTSRTGYGALISAYGPLSWAAYIGSHVYRRDVLAAFLQYRFTEFIYSHVFKQALFFCSRELNYGYYAKPVITRVSLDESTAPRVANEDLRAPQIVVGIDAHPQNEDWRSLKRHRVEAGLSECSWITIVGYLSGVPEARIFNVLANSMNINAMRSNTGAVVASRQPLLWNILCWSINSIGYKRIGQSFYFPKQARNGSLQDIRYAADFLNSFAVIMEQHRSIYGLLNTAALGSFEAARRILNAYLNSLPMNDDDLKTAYEHLLDATKAIPMETYYRMNDLSYRELIGGR